MGNSSPRGPPIHRRRRSLPFLLLASLAAVLLYSYCRASLPLFSPAGSSPSTPLALRRDAVGVPSTFSFTVKVLAFDRIESLRRCLRSLSAADYGGDRVDLHVFVDHFRGLDPAANESDLVDRKLREAHRILNFLDRFGWQHGEKLVHYRTGNAGLQAQWLEAWWPGLDDEFAFVVEDDLEVSPLYYKFLKGLIARYYYDPSNFSPSIYGASLQRPRFVPGKHGNKLQLDGETHLFLYQLVGTWGQLLFPKPWKEFRLWYDRHKSKGIKPVLQGMVTTGWYKRMGEKIWTPWFIKFIHSRGYYNIYTNFLNERALSISYRDAGVNYGRSAGPDSFLLDASSLDFNLWEMNPLRNLKWYDFCFRQIHPGRIARSVNDLGPLLDSLKKESMIILVSLFGTPQTLVRNLLCHFERLDIRNYILIGVNSEFLRDLARIGHAVVDADQLIASLRRYNLIRLQDSVVLVKEVLVKAYILKKSLERGYNTWVVEGDMIPIGDAFTEPAGPSYDFFASTRAGLLYAKSSPTSVKTWNDDIIYDIMSAAKPLATSGGATLSHHRAFISSALNALEKTSAGQILKDDNPVFAVELAASPANNTFLENGKMMLLCPPGMATETLQGALENVGMWLIDGDSSCTAVFCHQS